MSISTTLGRIDYPESDGQPMGETDLHRKWMIRINDILQYRYHDQRVYVTSDLLVYYRERHPAQFVVPDNFVVLDCDPGMRRVFKTWEEGRVQDVVFEVTSLSTSTNDLVDKPKTYERVGVQEYFLYDPTEEYLDAPLQGFRLDDEGLLAAIPLQAGQFAFRRNSQCSKITKFRDFHHPTPMLRKSKICVLRSKKSRITTDSVASDTHQ